jgi:hypothetical protein
MRIASHIATALSAATGRSDRPNDWPFVGACMAYLASSRINSRPEQGSITKPE